MDSTNKHNPFHVIVRNILNKKGKILNLVDNYNTPFYIYDEFELKNSVDSFVNAFSKRVPQFVPYYAMKLNHHEFIIKSVIDNGFGIDVASIYEMKVAIRLGANKIVYYSPAKDEKDLLFAIDHNNIVRIHLDSFNELKLLGSITNKVKKRINCSVRINFPHQGTWKKYGIPIESLLEFWNESRKYKYINLNGIHFHQSRNKDSKTYVKNIKILSDYLKAEFNQAKLKEIQYIDLGGGFEHYLSEGVIIRNKNRNQWPTYKVYDAYYTIDDYAKDIGCAIKEYLAPIVNCYYIFEPGRYIANNAMHIVLSVVDIKDEMNCVLDGGVNMVGWQRFEYEYFPLINISNESITENKCNMWGNLCTTWDIWGYYYYGKNLNINDVIVVPYQGALTYSLAQNFIFPIPNVYKL